MSADHPRVLELRRRVQADPASIAFAQLAEESRRKGDNDEAVRVCHAGLAHHPGYLSARVTLGRALIGLGRLDEAHAELMHVLTRAPDNLDANRAIAEIYQLRGQLFEALVHCKRALEIAHHDSELEHQVERIESIVSPPPPRAPETESASTAIEDIFDFDTLLEQLGFAPQSTAESTPPPTAAPGIAATPSALDPVGLVDDDGDPFSRLERQLRHSEERRSFQEVVASAADERAIDQRVMAELESWLFAILTVRGPRPSA